MDDVRGDCLGPSHITTPAAVIANKIKTEIARDRQNPDRQGRNSVLESQFPDAVC